MKKTALASTALCAMLVLSPGFALAGSDDHAAHHADTPNAAQTDAAMSQGVVKKIDASTGKLTIQHGPLRNLGMPPMTMVFRVKDAAWLAQYKAGDAIRFVAEDIGGILTVTAMEPR